MTPAPIQHQRQHHNSTQNTTLGGILATTAALVTVFALVLAPLQAGAILLTVAIAVKLTQYGVKSYLRTPTTRALRIPGIGTIEYQLRPANH